MKKEFKHIKYVERPHTILKLLQQGFSIDDIKVLKSGPCHYDIIAEKKEKV